MHWTNYVVNLEPMALWTTEQQCWAFRNGPSSILEGSSDIAREGCHGMAATRRMPYVSISWFHHWGAVQFQTNDLGNCDIDSQKATRLNRIRWFTKLQGKDIQKIKAFRKMPRVFPSKLKAPQFGSFPKLSFWASSFCLQLEIWTNTLSPKLTFVQIICCFYAQSFGFVSEDVWVLQHMGHKSATLDLAFDKSQQNYGEFCLLRHEWHGWQMEAFRRLPSYL